MRNRPSFAHRLCLRVSTDVSKGILELTDMGAGMTRADLINSLGIGRLSPVAHAASKQFLFHPPNQPQPPQEEDHAVPVDVNVDDSTSHSTTVNDNDDSSSGPDSEEEVATQNGTRNETEKQSDTDTTVVGTIPTITPTEQKEEQGLPVPCRSSDIGGFYAAICALGVGVNVGTKVRSMLYNSICAQAHYFYSLSYLVRDQSLRHAQKISVTLFSPLIVFVQFMC
jgi:hypothetical protein